MGVERSTFVIDPEGKLSAVYRKVKPAKHTAEVLRDFKRATWLWVTRATCCPGPFPQLRDGTGSESARNGISRETGEFHTEEGRGLNLF
jgi:alkyl hydroperoxide reductase subunit AhpC